MGKKATIIIQRRISPKGIPAVASLRFWADKAREGDSGVLLLRIVDTEESATLNGRYRGKDFPTNVLSFKYAEWPLGEMILGDVVICAPVVAREAAEGRIDLRGHWAHLVVHGVLHLRGFDHAHRKDAALMESRESAIITSLGFPDPYVD